MLVLSGYSETRSTYCKESSYIRLYGWCLTPNITHIDIFHKTDKIGTTFISIERYDIWESYNKVGSPICGWEYEGFAKEINLENLSIQYMNNEKKIYEHSIEISFDTNKEKYLQSLSVEDKSFIHSDNQNILNKLSNFVNVKSFKFDENEYWSWFKNVDYQKNYPNYCNEFKGEKILHIKALQHYISIELLKLKDSDIYMDVASSQSVCPDIIKKYHTKNIYRQDIRYQKGIHDEYVGSNAENIPFDNNSIDKMALHCSFEHFENNSDIGFLKEAYRLLKPNGKLVITPLYMSEVAHILTSPSIWENKYSLEGFPIFTNGYKIVFSELIKQRQEKIFSPDTLLKEIIDPFRDYFNFQIYYIDSIKDVLLEKYPKFTLVATKKV